MEETEAGRARAGGSRCRGGRVVGGFTERDNGSHYTRQRSDLMSEVLEGLERHVQGVAGGALGWKQTRVVGQTLVAFCGHDGVFVSKISMRGTFPRSSDQV